MSAMEKLHYGALPAFAKFGIGAGVLFIWTVFEHEVIERFGIYQYMPFYRVGAICAWDILAITVIIIASIVMSKKPVSA
jgi:hypothetical protein